MCVCWLRKYSVRREDTLRICTIYKYLTEIMLIGIEKIRFVAIFIHTTFCNQRIYSFVVVRFDIIRKHL